MDTVKAAVSFLHFSGARLVCVKGRGLRCHLQTYPEVTLQRNTDILTPPEAYRNCTDYRLPLRLGSVGCVDGVLAITGSVSVKCAPVCPFSVGICVYLKLWVCAERAFVPSQ